MAFPHRTLVRRAMGFGCAGGHSRGARTARGLLLLPLLLLLLLLLLLVVPAVALLHLAHLLPVLVVHLLHPLAAHLLLATELLLATSPPLRWIRLLLDTVLRHAATIALTKSWPL